MIGASVAIAMTTDDGKGGSGGDSPAASASQVENTGQKPAPGDAKITACELADFSKWPSAEVTVTNHSSETSDYQVRIDFVDPAGEQIAQAVANATGLAAGEVTQVSAKGTAPVAGEIDCKITEVLRKAS
ncbi:FxLYD domain-containing protein [Streptomyces sp. NPDC001070]